MSSLLPVDRASVEAAARRLTGLIRLTPLVLDPQSGLWLKCENEQITGSFKLRGALNRAVQLDPEDRSRGLVAASAGNHGQGVAYAARLLGTRASIVVPAGAVGRKVDAIRALGAEVVTVEGGYAAAEAEGRRVAVALGAVWISPYNDAQVVAGQGTIGLEIELQWTQGRAPGVAEVFVPVGGGGLVSGIAAALAALRPNTRVIGVLPENSAYLHAYFHSGTMDRVIERPTLADGLAGAVEADSVTLPLIRALVDDMILVSEDEIRGALSWAWHRERVIEPSAAVALAGALRSGSKNRLAVLSGGNVDPWLWEDLGRHA
jgi:threonine dehydratase